MQDQRFDLSDGLSSSLQATLSSNDQVFADALEPGEWIAFQSECLRQTGPDSFESTGVALTQRRVLLAGPAFPWGVELKGSHDLHTCAVARGKERPDGSRLMVMSSRSGPVCLYFDPERAQEADAIVVAIGFSQPAVPETPDLSGLGTFEFGQELHSISLMGLEDEEDGS